MRFQSQVPRTIMHLTPVIFTLPLNAAARRWNGPPNRQPAAAAWRKSRRFILVRRYYIRIRQTRRGLDAAESGTASLPIECWSPRVILAAGNFKQDREPLMDAK